VLTAQSNITELRTRNRNSLNQKVTANVSGLNWYRADYELRQLRRIKEISKRTFKLLMHARTCESFVQFSRELDRWIERERILLRIPLPASAKVAEPKSRGSLNQVQRGLVVEEQAGPAPVTPTDPPVQPS
jgi:hypothetical protein